MKLSISVSKKGYVAYLIDKKNQRMVEINNLDNNPLSDLVKGEKVSIELSPLLVNVFTEGYPIMPKKKLLLYHKKKYQELYDEEEYYKLKIKHIKNHYVLTSYHLLKDTKKLLENITYNTSSITLIGENNKKNNYLYIGLNDIFLYLKNELVYFGTLNDFIVANVAQNIIKAIYQALYVGQIDLIIKNDDKKVYQLITYIKQNIEKRVEIIEV